MFVPNGKTIVSLFEEIAERKPSDVALVFEGKKLTYQELSGLSNQLAYYLKSHGVNEEALVPICFERGWEMMVAVLAVLKAGAAYVPIDTDYPIERVKFIIEDCNASLLITDSEIELLTAAQPKSLVVINLKKDWPLVNEFPKTNIQLQIKPNQLAYINYTSGSTGNPKGVMIEHKSVVDYVYGLNAKTNITSAKSFALVSTIATDLGNTSIYGAWLSGASLHVFSKQSVSDADAMHAYFQSHPIDCLKIVPSHWKALSIDKHLLLPTKLLVFGGEALTADILNSIKQSDFTCEVVNNKILRIKLTKYFKMTYRRMMVKLHTCLG